MHLFVAPLPTFIGVAAFDALSTVVYLFAHESRANLEGNLRHVLPDAGARTIRQVARASFRNQGRNYYDLLRTPRMSSKHLARRVQFDHLEHLEAARERGTGVIVASAHLGNLDLVTQSAPLIDMELVVLAERLKPQKVCDFVMKLRTARGLEFVVADAGGIKAAFRALRDGKFVGLACDRNIQGQGVTMPFLGQPTVMPVGVAELALRTGATILPTFNIRMGSDSYQVVFEAPIMVEKPSSYSEDDVRALAVRILEPVERNIRAYPDQWMAFQPIWGAGAAATIAEPDGLQISEAA
ncbi:MAG: lysophospholipid acyltransferase family protein [Chloroflexi bacterium]|nr:lysophospholipid acyltransferase family protein [Chloroflexota bacterium]